MFKRFNSPKSKLPATEPTPSRRNLNVFLMGSEGLPFVEAVELANKCGVTIASGQELFDATSMNRPAASLLSKAMPCWTGTIICSGKDGQSFEKSATKTTDNSLERLTGTRYFISGVYTIGGIKQTYMFPIPTDKLGLVLNGVLFAEHPFSVLTDGNLSVFVLSSVLTSEFGSVSYRYHHTQGLKYRVESGIAGEPNYSVRKSFPDLSVIPLCFDQGVDSLDVRNPTDYWKGDTDDFLISTSLCGSNDPITRRLGIVTSHSHTLFDSGRSVNYRDSAAVL